MTVPGSHGGEFALTGLASEFMQMKGMDVPMRPRPATATLRGPDMWMLIVFVRASGVAIRSSKLDIMAPTAQPAKFTERI